MLISPVAPPALLAVGLAVRTGDEASISSAVGGWTNGQLDGTEGQRHDGVVTDQFVPRRSFETDPGNAAQSAQLGAALLGIHGVADELLAQLHPVAAGDALWTLAPSLPAAASSHVALGLSTDLEHQFAGIVDLAKLSAPARDAIEALRVATQSWSPAAN